MVALSGYMEDERAVAKQLHSIHDRANNSASHAAPVHTQEHYAAALNEANQANKAMHEQLSALRTLVASRDGKIDHLQLELTTASELLQAGGGEPAHVLRQKLGATETQLEQAKSDHQKLQRAVEATEMQQQLSLGLEQQGHQTELRKVEREFRDTTVGQLKCFLTFATDRLASGGAAVLRQVTSG